MKKIIILLVFIFVFYFSISFVLAGSYIPSDAIRIRIVANSNSKHDQYVKNKVKKILDYKIYNLVKDCSSSSMAREIINNNMSSLKEEINKILSLEKYNYKINYGYNYFPKKKYMGKVYKAGYYESLYIVLGKGKGKNWWCVLFPPFCLMESSDNSSLEYKSFVKDVLSKYFNY